MCRDQIDFNGQYHPVKGVKLLQDYLLAVIGLIDPGYALALVSGHVTAPDQNQAGMPA